MAAQIQRGVPQSQLSPKYLHTNSTSHTWPFSAIAELIDNAYDPDVRAKQFWIDKTLINGQDCLTFMDNGHGLNYEKMHKMLSFGYSDKKAINGHVPIGLYGNGFKSGSMRLGKDALVFSKSRDVMSVGMLSQTYLDKIKAEQIIVPIVTFQRISDKFCVCEKHKASLKEILTYSLFKTEKELHTELGTINSTCSTGSTGTRIIIWNLRRTSTGTTEFELNDRYDIQIPSDVYETTKERYKRPERFTQSIPESDYSLRAYCSILYLKPWMQIIIRGQKVKTQLISKSLAYIAKDHYKPTYLSKRVPITFGYNTKSKDQYGIMMYHKNRLIKAYERLGCQLKANVKGLGVIGVIECNFLEPTHNKQDFDNTDKYRNTMNSLAVKLEEYWKEILHKKAIENPKSTTPVEDTMKRPDQNWVQCDTCLQWRKLPDGIDFDRLPEKWFCHMNPDPQFRSCNVEEEPEDSDDDQPSYQKTYKQKEKMDKMVQERQRQQLEERQKQEEEKRLALLAHQNEALMLQQDDLKRQLDQTARAIAHSPAAPDTPKARVKRPRGGARSSTRTQAEPSPSSDAMPVISSVFLSTPSRMKTTQSTASRRNSKRPRLNVSKTHDELESASPEASQSSPVDDDDDDIIVLETTSTPRPRRPSFDVATVKQETCSDEAALVTRPEASTATTSSSRETVAMTTAAMATSLSPPTISEMQQVGVTTQTELPNIKNEEEKKKKKGSNEREGGREGEQVNGDAHPEAQNPRQENRGSPAEDREEDADQSSSPAKLGTDAPMLPATDLQSMSKVQEQQDRLLELMQATAEERDAYRDQVHSLICKVHDLETSLAARAPNNVKKEREEESGEDLKRLYEEAKREAEELRQERDTLLAAGQGKPGPAQPEEENRVSDEMALQVDALLRALDQSNRERDELGCKVECMEGERAALTPRCERLQSDLAEARRELQERVAATQSTVSPPGGSGTVAGAQNNQQGADSTSQQGDSLRELRRTVGRLLVTYVPALDLEQVNYDCNVIDEILEQVLTDMESMGTM